MTDPRYDPRFQRDWKGEVPPAPAPPSVAPAPRAEPPRAPLPEPISSAATDPVEGAATAEPESEPTAGSIRNPYRIALTVLGVVLVLSGGGMLWQLAQPMESVSNPSDYVLPQLEGSVAPWIALAGLLAIIAAIALGAFHRR